MSVKFSLALVLVVTFLSSNCLAQDDSSCHFKIPRMFFPKLRYLCSDVDRFANCLIEKNVISSEESDELKLLLEKDDNCKFAENDLDMQDQVEQMLENEELCYKFKDMSHHLFAVMKCLKKT